MLPASLNSTILIEPTAATITDTCATDVDDICTEYTGTDNNDEEPEEIGSGVSDACIYTDPLPSC